MAPPSDPLLLALEDRLAVLMPGRFRLTDDATPTPLGLTLTGHDTLTQQPITIQVLDTAKLLLQPATIHQSLTAQWTMTARLSDRLHRADAPWMPAVILNDPSGTPPFLIQEQVPGLSLAGVMERRGTGTPPHLAPGAVRPLLTATLELLAGMHGLGLTLPGLRPESILTTDATPRVRVLTPLPDPLEADPARWLPPEVLEGGLWTTAADCYLAGAVIYWALTGFAPFEAELADEGYIPESQEYRDLRQQRRVYTALPVAPSARVHGVPTALERVLLSLLQRDPGLRPEAAAALEKLSNRTATTPLTGLLSRFTPKVPDAEPTPEANPVVASAVPVTSDGIDFDDLAASAPEVLAESPTAPPWAAEAEDSTDVVLPEPRSAATWQRPALIGGAVLLLALTLWAVNRPSQVQDPHAEDRTLALLSDIGTGLVPVQVEEAPPSQPLDKPQPAAPKQNPQPPQPDQPTEPAPATMPPPAPESPSAPAATLVLPPEVTTPTPVPDPAPPTEDPVPAPAPEATTPVTTPAPAAPTPDPDPVPSRDPAPADRPSGQTHLFNLDEPSPATDSTTPAMVPLPGPGRDPAPLLEQPQTPSMASPSPLPGTSGTRQWGFSAHERQVWSVDVSPDGKTVASGGRDEYAALWDLTSGRKRGQVTSPGKDHVSWITSVSYSRDGRYLATGSEDARVKVWDLRNGNALVTTFRTPGDSVVVRALDFDPTSSRLYVGYGDGKGMIRVLDTATGKEIPTKLQHGGALQAMQISPDGRLLATGGRDNRGRLWNLKTGEMIALLEGHKGWVQAIAFNGKGQVATGSSDGSIRLWKTDGSLVATLAGAHTGGVYSLAYRQSDGRLLASGGADNAIRLWDHLDGRSVGQLTKQGGIVTSLVFAPGGKQLIASTLQDPFGGTPEPNILVYRIN